jgi:hypothetical protein
VVFFRENRTKIMYFEDYSIAVRRMSRFFAFLIRLFPSSLSIFGNSHFFIEKIARQHAYLEKAMYTHTFILQTGLHILLS